MDSEQTFVVKKKCPICGNETRIVKVKSRMIALKTDPDMCTHYDGFNPYLYAVWVCEHCSYAADERTFSAVMPARHKEALQKFIEGKKLSMPFQQVRDAAYAIATYKLAIMYAGMIDTSQAKMAGLNLKLAWVYRIAGDHENEEPYLRKAAELYDESVMKERYPIGPLTDSMAIYLTGAIYYILKEYESATQYISRLISDQELRNTDPKMYDRARFLWQDVRDAKTEPEEK